MLIIKQALGRVKELFPLATPAPGSDNMVSTGTNPMLMLGMRDMRIFFESGAPGNNQDCTKGYRVNDFYINIDRFEIYHCVINEQGSAVWSYNVVRTRNFEWEEDRKYSKGDHVEYMGMNFRAEKDIPAGRCPGVGDWSMRMINTFISGSFKNRSSICNVGMACLVKAPGYQWSIHDIVSSLEVTDNEVIRSLPSMTHIARRMNLLVLFGLAKYDLAKNRWTLLPDFINYASKFAAPVGSIIDPEWATHLVAPGKTIDQMEYDRGLVERRKEIVDKLRLILPAA